MFFGYSKEQNAATFEHLKPKSKSGTGNDNNLVIACKFCNEVRDTASPGKFERSVVKLLQNSIIKNAWHKFTPEQTYLLRKEIEFADVEKEVNKRNPNAFQVKMYANLLKERKLYLQDLYAKTATR